MLRLLYFALALGSCLLIATGNLLWLEKRLAHRMPPRGLRLVAGLSVGACGGVILALAGAMWTTRLLPQELSTRMDWVIGVFTVILLASPVIDLVSSTPRRALVRLLAAADMLFAALPGLDWMRIGGALRGAIDASDAAVPVV